ncbi:MAG: glycosyltransferase family 1 protein [Bacteroidetes bacterium]|nr:MAG: glycosyltransferase family 1 protein [Bacteroidota bacterium]REK04916.1 MAG: glycosyltransferase family 1 protein [Bacteroidota bacterium]REK32865.1 MAG: glycosyltransferase family 1 protein [Bacteroidota bacterium]REK50946.1 MAG: glycosyltransferase family 1 protein [Bacteroidota bacterium]
MKKSIKVVALGPFPPPRGGVSVHLERLRLKSCGQSGISLSVFDIKRFTLHSEKKTRSFFRIAASLLQADIIHIHLHHPLKILPALLFRVLVKKILYTHHNSRGLQSFSFRMMMKLSHKIIFVNEDAYESFSDSPKSFHIPAYIPVAIKKQEQLNLGYGSGERKFRIASLCWHPRTPETFHGKDLYGFDLIIEAIRNIPNNDLNRSIELILLDPNKGMKQVYERMINDLNDEGNIAINYLCEEVDFPEWIRDFDLYIRAARSDGDSLSVREALEAGVQVLASDVCSRPEGTRLFKTDDALNLSRQIAKLSSVERKSPVIQPDYSLEIFELYKKLL